MRQRDKGWDNPDATDVAIRKGAAIPGMDWAYGGFYAEGIADELTVSGTTKQSLHTDEEVDRWIKKRREMPALQVEMIPLDQLDGWTIDPDTGNIAHASGLFFTILGAQARLRSDEGDLEWDQPIIDQSEIGILGILAKRIDGVLHFCLQTKAEPGTIHAVQLSPTVQATYSNYMRIHGGDRPDFVSYFIDPPADRIIFAKLQTEDGGRFLFKSNRNMIVRLDDQELTSLPDGYLWLTLRQIRRLMRVDNIVNACSRSVLSGMFLGAAPGDLEDGATALRNKLSPHSGAAGWKNYAEVFQWLDDRKNGNHIYQKRIPLKELRDWRREPNGQIVHRGGRYFKIAGVKVNADGREVRSWSQPILVNVASGIIGMLVRQGPGGAEFLMQAKAEIGNRNIIQIGPTVQFTQENYTGDAAAFRPFLFEQFQDPHDFIPLVESRQSEEGARFFREAHVHRVLMLPPNIDLDLPPDYRWLTADQIRMLLHMGEWINSCGRSILACLM